jgi:GT2 family glycosyltransferase
MSESSKIAIVILNWNGAHLFAEFLPSVIRHSLRDDVSIIVADNGSTDNSIAYLKENFPQINIIELEANYGFAKGYNIALQQVNAEYFVLLNSDIEVTEDWLTPCINQLDSSPAIAALQPKILSYRNRDQFEYAGAAGGFIDQWGFPFCRGRILSHTEVDVGQYDDRISLFWATGACLFIRASVFRDSGGFDDDFFAHMEEIDLCWRLKNQGWQIGFEPESVVYHLGGATLSYQSPKKVFLNFRNNLWMLFKNLPTGRLVPVMFFRLILDGVAAAHFISVGQFSAFYAVFKAHMAFYASLKKFIAKRKLLLPKVVKQEHPEIFNGSMVFRFYLRKQKKFNDFGIDTMESKHQS